MVVGVEAWLTAMVLVPITMAVGTDASVLAPITIPVGTEARLIRVPETVTAGPPGLTVWVPTTMGGAGMGVGVDAATGA